MTVRRAFVRDERGAAAAEMALILPLLLMLLFGGMEGGNFFWREHQVVKAAREGARFAARQSMEFYDCAAGTISTVADANGETVEERIARVTAANLVGEPVVTVAMVGCAADSQFGLYAEKPDGAPIVSVNVTVPYQSLMATMIFDDTMTLGASAQAAVMGL